MGPPFGRLERGDENQQEVLLVMRVVSSAALSLTPNLLCHLNLPLPSAVFLDSQQALGCLQIHSQHPLPSGPSLLGGVAHSAVREIPFSQLLHGPAPPSSGVSAFCLGTAPWGSQGGPTFSGSLWAGYLSSDLTTFSTCFLPLISKLSPSPAQFWGSLPLLWGCPMEKEILP